jgi:hypothetical protein
VARRFEEDERGERRGLRARRVLMGLLTLVPLLALTGVLGQRAHVSAATGPRAQISLRAPATVRGGLFFQARVDIRATGEIQHPQLLLDPGWLEGMQVNSIEPQADSESSRGGRLVLSYTALHPGDVVRLWLQFQVNPTNAGHLSYALQLDDGNQRIARVQRDITVLP